VEFKLVIKRTRTVAAAMALTMRMRRSAM